MWGFREALLLAQEDERQMVGAAALCLAIAIATNHWSWELLASDLRQARGRLYGVERAVNLLKLYASDGVPVSEKA